MFTGTVSFVTKNGFTYARATYRLDGKRKQIWRKVEGRKSDAKEKVIREVEKILANADTTPKTFSELADYFIKTRAIPAEFVNDEKVRGTKTFRQMRSVVMGISAFYKDVPLHSFTRDAIIRYRLHIIGLRVKRVVQGRVIFNDRSMASVNQHLRILRSILNVGEQERWLDRVPSFKGLISLAAEVHRSDIPSREDFKRILDATQARQRLNHIKPIALLIADTGSRPVELWQLQWKDVDLEKMEVTLMNDKGVRRNYRTVPLTSRIVTELRELPRLNSYVFGGIKSVKRGWASIREIAGTSVDLYSLRHVFATRIDMIPISQNQRQKLMGHSTKETFGRYAKLTQETMDMVREYLEKDDYLPTNSQPV